MTELTNQTLTGILFGLVKDPVINMITNILDIYQINKIKNTCGIYDIMESGFYVGSLEMIKHAQANENELCDINIVIEYGYLECVKYLYENGCP